MFNFAGKFCLAIVLLTLYFCNPVAAVDLQNTPNVTPANGRCYDNGDVITLRGTASPQSLTLANDAVSTVWVLTTDKPICIVRSSGDSAPQTANVLRLQIIGSPPPVDVIIELKGKLSTGNDSQYYAEPDAIEVISGRRVPGQSPIVALQNIDASIPIGGCAQTTNNGQPVKVCRDMAGMLKILPLEKSSNSLTKEIKDLIDIEGQLNDECRSGSGDKSATEKACNERDRYFDKIHSLGWCWGKLGQVEAEMTWHICGKDSEQAHTAQEVVTALEQRLSGEAQQGKAPTPNGMAGGKENSSPWLLLILLSPFFLRWAWKSGGKLEIENRIEKLVKAHVQTLSRKRSQTVFKDDYGNQITTAWEKEKTYFRDNVVFPLFSARDRKIYEALRTTTESIIEAAVNSYRQDGDALEVDGISFSPAMNPYDYERFCAELLKKAGWDARATKASGDQGSDVIAEKNGTRIVLQCKLYTQPVGNKAVQEVFAAKTFEKADHAAVVTNETYTPSARKIAMSTGVSLLHHNELLQWAEAL